ncbi:disease resistance protein [Tripterygium wilfordii]|uniref:Disease resistance protein n=1 Tax=Tripterygium wilfordii TaxID=458696 RepID=A0A7J7CA83_TRIWF|nr:probable disease resistance protein At4g27220 [Tripterygium wilfordii]KAF5730656.1 disease resistance protein [Tripterygium wilfordii]
MESIGKAVLSWVSNKVNHHVCLDENVNKLKRKFEYLNGREEDVVTRLGTELQQGKKLKKEVEVWLGDVQRINDERHAIESEIRDGRYLLRTELGKRVVEMTDEAERLYQKGSFPCGLVFDAPRPRGEILATTNLVGQTTAQRKMEEIWKILKHNDNVRKIGLYGMGGSGKTTLMKHINNRLLEDPPKFGKVIWITVSKPFNISRLQHDIGTTLDLDLSRIEDETKRASKIHAALRRKRRCVIILDDMWEAFPLEAIGIPEPTQENKSKLVLTTRSLDVCRRMECEGIKMELLSKEEAWELFSGRVGNHVLVDPSIEAIARKVADECACLPLAVVTVAGSMRAKDDLCEWRTALRELREVTERHTDILETLKFSYNRLKNQKLQECFLYCALYPEDFEIDREELIEHLIAEGIIDVLDCRKAEHDKGHVMLNELENACLLERVEGHQRLKCVKMHDLIRDMAIRIMSVSPRSMVKAGLQLREIPDEENWTADLEKVSLMKNYIEEIPSSHRPRCHSLSTLFLSRNEYLSSLSDSLFLDLCGVKVLDLSYTRVTELPSSISNLGNLRALLLRCCEMECVPSLSKNRALKKLDLCDCARLKEVPHGIEMLSNLTYLNLHGTIDLEELPSGILPKLSRLQFLKFHCFSRSLTVAGQEIARLRKLETLECQFSGVGDFNKYVSSLANYPGPSTRDDDMEAQRLNDYLLVMGPIDGTSLETHFREKKFSKEAWLLNYSIGREAPNRLVLPKDIQSLFIEECHDLRSLCNNIPSLKYATELKCLEVEYCDGVECLLSLSSSASYRPLQSLEKLCLEKLESLRVLFNTEGFVASPSATICGGTFSCLKIFVLSKCPNIKQLFPPGLLPNLQNLEEIQVTRCEKLEGFIVNNNVDVLITEFKLPKLKVFKLCWLPELKSICGHGVAMACDSLQVIDINCCWKLKRIPFVLPAPSPLKKIYTNKEWWESLEWDHLDAKNALQPLCQFIYTMSY